LEREKRGKQKKKSTRVNETRVGKKDVLRLVCMTCAHNVVCTNMESYGHTDKGMHVGVASISRDETWVRLLNDVAKLAALSLATRPTTTTMSYRRRRRRRRRHHILL